MSKLRQISFTNFKRFDRFTIACRDANILVGPNNAGKSTALDALRILYGAYRYARRLRPKLIWTSSGEQTWGYEVPDFSIPVSTTNMVRNYGDDDAVIEMTHENGSRLVLELQPDHLTRIYLREPGRHIGSGKAYFSQFPIDIVIVPTLSPFEQDEPYVTDETVDRNRANRLASRYFRNIWYRSTPDDFARFSELITSTWPGISITPSQRPHSAPHSLEMFYREGRIDREVAWSGFGFQVWLQIITHVLRGNSDSVFVLDEPDIYLHPDLQFRLLSLIKANFNQFFIATHSAEIINRASPGDIVSVNSQHRTAKRVKSDSDYNEVFAYIGSIENVELSKLSRAKRVIFFEGKDKALLAKFCEKAHLSSILTDNETLVIGVGGFGQWRRVVEAAWTFRNVLQVSVSILAVFDRDYRDPREINEMIGQISSQEVSCSVWNRKEIENYALTVRSASEAILKRVHERSGDVEFTLAEAEQIIDEVSDAFRYDVHAQIVSNTLSYERRINSGKDASQITKDCSKKFDSDWPKLERRLAMVPGKQFVADLSSRLQRDFGTSLTMSMLMAELRITDLDPELVSVLKKIDEFCCS